MIIDNKSQLNTHDEFDIVTYIYVSMYQLYQCYICHQVSCVSNAFHLCPRRCKPSWTLWKNERQRWWFCAKAKRKSWRTWELRTEMDLSLGIFNDRAKGFHNVSHKYIGCKDTYIHIYDIYISHAHIYIYYVSYIYISASSFQLAAPEYQKLWKWFK